MTRKLLINCSLCGEELNPQYEASTPGVAIIYPNGHKDVLAAELCNDCVTIIRAFIAGMVKGTKSD